jgi:hypothetical protein
MRMKLHRPLFAFLVAIPYLAATMIAAESPLASCPALETALHATHTHHNHGVQHQHSSPISASECLKCCIGACLVVPCLPGPSVGISEPAFVGLSVLYWAVSPAISGRAVIPDPGPPRPIA